MWWLIVLGLILIVAAVYMLKRPAQESVPVQDYMLHPVEVLADQDYMDDKFTVPQRWDEQLIAQQLGVLRKRPPVLSHYVSSVIDRFVLRQDDRTAQARTQFLRSQIEQLKLAKDLHVSIDDLRFHEIERDIRQRTLEIKKQDLDNKQQQQQELAELTHEHEKLKVKLQISRLSRQIKEEERPPEPPSQLSPEQEREQRRSAIEARMARKREAKRKAVEDAPTEEDGVRIANMYDDSIQRDMEEMGKVL